MGFNNLLVEFAHEQGASMIIRGLRAVSDFEYEFQMASANKRLHHSIETLLLMAEQQHFVASRLVKEVAQYGGEIRFCARNRSKCDCRKTKRISFL